MGSTETSRVNIEENVGLKGAIAERVVELQNSLRAEKAANIMHQKRIEELERRLCLHTRTHGAAPSSGDVESQEITISQLTEQRLRYREGLRQVATILKEGLDVRHSSDSEAECSTHSLIRSAVQSAKASVARRGNQKFQHLCASIPITACEQKLATADPVSVFVQKYRLLEGKLQITQQELSQAHEDARQIRLSAGSRICFEQFAVGCVALFIRTCGKVNNNANSIYVAFHRACPRRFLSAESIEQCRRGADPSFILGRVIFIEPKVADDDTIFPVPVGETYYLLTAAIVDNT